MVAPHLSNTTFLNVDANAVKRLGDDPATDLSSGFASLVAGLSVGVMPTSRSLPNATAIKAFRSQSVGRPLLRFPIEETNRASSVLAAYALRSGGNASPLESKKPARPHEKAWASGSSPRHWPLNCLFCAQLTCFQYKSRYDHPRCFWCPCLLGLPTPLLRSQDAQSHPRTLSQRPHIRRRLAKARSVLPYLVGNVARCEMTIMPLDHTRVGMTEIASDHHQRHPRHDRQARPSVTQDVEAYRRIDARILQASWIRGACQLAFHSLPSNGAEPESPRRKLTEKLPPLIRQDNVPILVRLATCEYAAYRNRR